MKKIRSSIEACQPGPFVCPLSSGEIINYGPKFNELSGHRRIYHDETFGFGTILSQLRKDCT